MSAEVSDSVPEFVRMERAKRAANHSEKRLVVLGQGGGEKNLFLETLKANSCSLEKSQIEILQINLGKLCNLTCAHCHVEAGPNRTEHLNDELIDVLLQYAEQARIHTVDLTGGAPEMCNGFTRCVSAFRALGCEVIVRSNLTILLEPGFESMADFFAEHQVRVVASLPCYSEKNVDAQRGDGVFTASIAALLRLNALGYGQPETGLKLDLVYNPGGASLPGSQQALQAAYKEKLFADFGVRFNALYAITNIPIGRFYSDLKAAGKAESYDELLRNAFNSATVPQLMCRNTLNVSWDGWIYDCDFNQMIELPMQIGTRPLHVCDLLERRQFEGLPIQTGNHCFACTAGAGSSCGGELL